MNDRNSSRLVIPSWIWAATVFVFLCILGVVMWVGSSSSPQRIDVSDRDYAKPSPPPINYGSVRPYDIAPQDVRNRSAAKVTVTPVEPERTSPEPVGKPAKSNRATNSVRDMFPMGPIVDSSIPDRQKKEPDTSATRVGENFPEFTYDGRRWFFTGKFAASSSLDLAPIDADVDGRRIYSLTDGAASDQVLFVQSRDPEKYAVYRSTT